MWTHFWDMHSGGVQKEDFHHCFIEAPQREAEVIFYKRFGHNPNRVTCTCCGSDYSISEYPTLAKATEFHRGARYDFATKTTLKPTISLRDYVRQKDVKIIKSKDIKDDERVWVG